MRSAEAIGAGRATVYAWREEDEAFAAAWDVAVEESTDSMEREALRRAVRGTDKPVFQGGELVGTISEHSDTLLIFMLKARRPNVYRDHVKVDVDAKGTAGVMLVPGLVSVEDWAKHVEAEKARTK